MKIRIDESTCTGHGICEMLAPRLFEVGDDGIARFVATPTEADHDLLLDAIDQCPTRALTEA